MKTLKRQFKVVLSLLLVAIIACSAVLPSFAAVELKDRGSVYPTIVISGDSPTIVDENNNPVFSIGGIFSGISIDKDSIVDMVVSVMKPYYLEGRLKGDYENYYQAIYDIIAPLFEKARLDGNGEPSNGTRIEDWRIGHNEWQKNNNTRQDDGFTKEAYHFWYDWRLDPLFTADELNSFIESVKRTTGCDKVVVNSMCLGTDVLMSYIAKYGTDSLYGVSFDGSVVSGAELLSDPICGKFNLDGDAIVRFLTDSNATGVLSIDEIVIDVVDVLEQSGVLGFVEDYTKAVVYNDVKEGVTSALARSTFFTWPGYWAPVLAQDYETAKEYVFGKEGSKLRDEYAGLIQKLDNYNTTVRQRIPELLGQIKESGVNICVIAKYGMQLGPITYSNDVIADQVASVKNASFGATTSTIYDTLTDKYIADQTKAGLGKYIAPDGQVDASTCYFRDNTWFVKGARHSNWTDFEAQLVFTVTTAERQLTVDDFSFSQFIVYDNEANTAEKMTVGNCDTYNWDANRKDDTSRNPFIRIRKFYQALKKLIQRIIEIVREKKAAEANPATR